MKATQQRIETLDINEILIAEINNNNDIKVVKPFKSTRALQSG